MEEGSGCNVSEGAREEGDHGTLKELKERSM